MKDKRGFTLIELMVVVAIIAVFAAIAVPSFSSWSPRLKFRTSADELHKVLMLARMTAISSNRDVVVTFDQANGTYEVAFPTETESYSLPDGVHFGTLTSTTITYYPTGQADANAEIQMYSSSPRVIDNKRKLSVKAVTGLVQISKGW
jgi:type IV fimbrial biogenesis protein FimU